MSINLKWIVKKKFVFQIFFTMKCEQIYWRINVKDIFVFLFILLHIPFEQTNMGSCNSDSIFLLK